MAVFTDGKLATLADLKQYEHSILDVAQTEGIDVAEKLALAKREIGLELSAFVLKKGALPRNGRELSSVVVTDPLVHWHAVHALSICYRDAFNSQLNDRYKGKWEHFQRLSERAQRLAFDIGIGLVSSPLPAPGAPFLDSLPGGVLPTTTYCVRIAWLGKQGCTGEWSDMSVLRTDPGTRLVVAIPEAPSGIQGAVPYVGMSEDSLYRQTDMAVAAGTSWVMPASGLITTLPDIPVQRPDYYVTSRRDLLRG